MRFRINATTHRERYEITNLVLDAVSSNNGFVLDSHLYSNISTVLNIEIAAEALDSLVSELEGLGLNVKCESPAGAIVGKLLGTLQITFVHNDPDIRHEVPMVPG